MRWVRLPLAAIVVLTAATLAQPRPAFDPGKPRDLEAIADGPFAVDLDWRRVSSAEYYEVFRDGNKIAETEPSRYRDEGLQPATPDGYRVRAVDDDGAAGDFSDPVEVTTDPPPGPTTPTRLRAAAVGYDRIALVWSPSESYAGIDFYRVFRDGSEIATPAEPSFEDSGLTPETSYEYRVSAVDVDGRESDQSEPASATTAALPPPPPPENFTAMAMSSSQVDLEWSPPSTSDTPVTGYNVYRDGALLGFVVATAFADTGLAPETTYRYAVSSVDDRGLEGERSAEVSATTDAAQDVIPPAPPTGLRLSGS